MSDRGRARRLARRKMRLSFTENCADGNTPAGEPGRSTTAASQVLRFVTGSLREAIDAADT
jgi:hypothetical protein